MTDGIDKIYMEEAIEELGRLFKNPRLVPQHLRDRLYKMDKEKTSVKCVKTSKGVILEPSEEFQCLLAELRIHVLHN